VKWVIFSGPDTVLDLLGFGTDRDHRVNEAV
jgi:hypothetical protein